jgi:hypothetical protein
VRTALAALAAILLAVPPAAGQDSLRIRRAGPGRAGVVLREAVAAPHQLLIADTGRVTLVRGTVMERSLLVVGGDLAVGAEVRGDVVVVGGDLYMHPGGAIAGRAVALGGCVYSSSLATIAGETECVSDAQFDVRRVAGIVEVTYRPPRQEGIPLVAVPFPAGFRIPEYTRVDGLGLPWGPRATLAGGRVEIDPIVTYRSATGDIDPQLHVQAGLGGLWFADLRGGRDTRTNDRWIRSDPLNSLLTLSVGRDVRNYYRSRYAVLRAGRRWERGVTLWSAWLGGQAERDRSTHSRAPWSAYDRRDSVEGMSRPNPPIANGDLRSALAGIGVDWDKDGVALAARVESEFVFDAPGDARFLQTTGHAAVAFPTFATQRLLFELHSVHTSGDRAVPQRFAYLGGSGTLPTRDLLSVGGDQLLFVESRYDIPIDRIRVRMLGSPVVSLRHMMGTAGVDSLPDLAQNLGIRIALLPLRVDFTHDPATGDSELRLGVGFGR